MKQYVIDELRPWDHEKIKAYLEQRFEPAEVDGLYWVPLAEELLDTAQSAHKDCQPYCFALELEPNRITFELLVRSRERVRCDCIGYASERQRDWLIRLADGILDSLGIIA